MSTQNNILPLYQIKNISKSYGHIDALKNVSFSVKAGEVIGLVGDNGAGKSTLIKILSGVSQPNSGQILYNGNVVKMKSYKDSQKIGIATIYQDRALVNSVSIYRNIFMGNEILNFAGFLAKKRMREESMRILEESINIGIDSPDSDVGELSGGQAQAVAIARAIYFKAKFLLLDEPTNHLSVRESNKVMDFVRKLRDEGISSLFVTHNLLHVHSIADRFICLNNGEIIGKYYKDEISLDKLERVIVFGKA
ncbi:MAG: ATP-binding cassette domain-containing protein [Actinobacteria bacterium]|nr:ATP-binding cassette domain-containing protein [Actinomycetota bacterium]